MDPILGPPATKGRFSIARLDGFWYVACRSRALADRPITRTILGTPLVLFRGDGGRPVALLDRCAHRNLPLSCGRIVAQKIECAYHGWQFDGGGVCRVVPGLDDPGDARGRGVPSYATIEQEGAVWVYARPGVVPAGRPFSFPCLGKPGYASVWFETEVEATVHATLENMLDVPHTAFLHRGLFRGGAGNEIRAVVRRFHDRVEAEYLGEPRPSGLVARLLAPGADGTISHFDRFILPSIAEIEYALGESSHLVVTNVLTPVGDFVTRFLTVVSFRLPLPAFLVRLVVSPIVRRIFAQDAVILRRQTESIRRFGGEQYASTALDLLGPQIWRLLREAEEGALAAVSPAAVVEREVRFRA